MMYQDKIIIRGLRQNTLKNVSLDIPKGKIVVFYRGFRLREIQHCI